MVETTRGAGWALILGASSGFGAASARALAAAGHHIAGVHFDLRATREQAELLQGELSALGRRTLFFNKNAADAAMRDEILDALAAELEPKGERVRLLLHSLAFGSLRPYLPTPEEPTPPAGALMDERALAMTLQVMAHSLVGWTRGLIERELLSAPGGRILALSSAGAHVAWPAYGAVSAAKAALEAHVRQLALELAPRGMTANALCPGVCDTPALRKIPGWERLLADAQTRNPHGRATTPDDVARVVAFFAGDGAAWINGVVLPVDGGEGIAGLASPSPDIEASGDSE